MPHPWRVALARRIRSEQVLWGLIVLLGAFALLMARMYREALTTVFYVPSAERLSVARAEAFKMPPHQVARFAEHFVSNYEGFTPATAEAQTHYLRMIVSEGMLARQPQVLARLREYAERGEIRSQVQIVPGTTRVTELRNRWEITMQVVKLEYTRGEPWRALMLECRVGVVPGVISEATPEGLLVEDYEQRSAPLEVTRK